MRHLKLLDECRYEVSAYDDHIDVITTVDGKDFKFSYPSYREGEFFNNYNIILADNIEDNTAEALINHLIKRASKSEERIFTKDERDELYKELFNGLIIEVDRISNQGYIENLEKEEEFLEEEAGRASFEEALNELDNLKK
jgi:hypothetical protein